MHYHLMCLPMTTKEGKSSRLLGRLIPDLSEYECLEFIRLFYWDIRTSPGGVDGLLRKWAI